ncbi:PREDICTED: F-box protein At3g12350 isoform X2 [Tarenaya hassleriana]|uniref:F-box protein At3g12350 isoform X2 n=1 Tax=Tarenaya hassleriana TaxID=28532 RepID=UPI00053C17ED|nr:PREDICTED: F-box protein At3g12350 isoform X2 [Tarenaya hassleriana]
MASGIDAFALSFSDIPEDVQLCVLSFLSPAEISSFACTSRRFAALCRDDGKLWHAMCDRRWGRKTQIQKWGKGRIGYRVLYRTLSEWENLIGFWRRCGRANPAASSPPLVFFEWGPSFMLGSRVSPTGNGTYHVMKTPFLWMGLSQEGRVVNFLDLDGKPGSGFGIEDLGFTNGNFVPVDVNFMGNCHFMVEENRCSTYNSRGGSKSNSSGDESEDLITGKSPDFMVSEMYSRFANRMSPGDSRRQRRKEKERQARIKWEPEHFVKVVDCSPTTTKPLQGLWKESRRLVVVTEHCTSLLGI